MAPSRGNKDKHESTNPIQRGLLRWFERQVIELVHRVAPRTILEVGCGEGYVLDALSRAGVSASLWGIDISADAVADARARLGARADIERRDARTLADEPRQFDVVLMLEVLEHMPDPEAMLPILERLTRRHVLLSVPWEPMFRGLNLMRGKNLRRLGNDPEHVNHWGRGEFLRLVERRFDVREAPIVAPWTMVLAERRDP